MYCSFRFVPTARALVLLACVGGCSPSRLLDVDRPNNVASGSTVNSATAAVSLKDAAVGTFYQMYAGNIPSAVTEATGRFSDEFMTVSSSRLPPITPATTQWVYELRTSSVTNPFADQFGPYVFTSLQVARVRIETATDAVHEYLSENSSALAHLQVLNGYVRLFLAEDFCAGVAFSTVRFNGDIQFGTPLSTADVYASAVTRFDSTIANAPDSTLLLNLALVGKGRALLDQGKFADAAAAVAAVPTSFVYNAEFTGTLPASSLGLNPPQANWFASQSNTGSTATFGDQVSVANRKGGNGLDFVSSGDPRTLSTNPGVGTSGLPFYVWSKYAGQPGLSVPLARGIEARLIEAEAALQADPESGVWLNVLNALRTTGSTTVAGCPSTRPAPCAAPGTGGVAGLPVLTDPGTAPERLDLLFRERAFWLFGTGSRMSDLRRLVRQYGRDQSQVFPYGTFPSATQPYQGLQYGGDVNFSIPTTEWANPNIPVGGQCTDRSA